MATLTKGTKVQFYGYSGGLIQTRINSGLTKPQLIELAESIGGVEYVEYPSLDGKRAIRFKRLHAGINGRKIDSWSVNYTVIRQG